MNPAAKHFAVSNPGASKFAALSTRNPHSPLLRGALWLTLAIVFAAMGGQAAVILGADANWDLQNYHLYSPFALLEGRLDIDHNAAGIQTYINPTLDLLLTYPAYVHGSPQLATRLMGALQGLNGVLILAIIVCFSSLLQAKSRPADHDDSGVLSSAARFIGLRLPVLALVATLLGLSGALTVSELGTSFGDLTTAVLVLAGLLLALLAVTDDPRPSRLQYLALAGLAVGIAAGLKLTNGVYLVALGLAVLAAGGGNLLRVAMVFGVGGAVGLLLIHGWWSWYLWMETGNPIFPYFNSLFGSPLYPDVDFSDVRFFPKDGLQALLYPFWFSWNSQTAENAFRDFRFPVAYLFVVALLIDAAKRLFKRQLEPFGAVQRRLLLFTVFLVLAYLLWQEMFSIQRYAIAIELLLPAFILIAAVVLLGRRGWWLFGAIALVFALSTKSFSWGRLSDEHAQQPLISESVVAEFAPMLDNAVVVLGRAPLAYVITAFPDQSSTVWIGPTSNEVDHQAGARKAAGYTRILALRRNGPGEIENVEQRLTELELPIERSETESCRKLVTTLEHLVLCEIGEITSPRE